MWRAAEYFSPPAVDRVDPSKRVFAVRPGRPLPWEPGSPLSSQRPHPRCAWQHTVYAGVFDIARMRDVLMEAFRAPDEESDFDGRVSGQSALLSFSVNQEGQLIKGSVTLSSCGWAVSRTLEPGPQDAAWLDGFELSERALVDTLLDVADGHVTVRPSPAQSGPPGGVPPGATAPQPSGRPVAGLMSTLATAVVRGGISGAAAVVGGGLGLGPIAGPVAANITEKVGDALLDRAGRRGEADETDDTSGSTDSADGSGDAEGSDDAQEPVDGPEPPAEVGTKHLDIHDLVAITRWVSGQLGIGEALHPDAIRIKSQQVREDRADEAGSDALMNSFYAEDLAQVARAVREGDAGRALVGFLTPEESVDPAGRVDVRTGLPDVLGGVRPDRAPAGRWPADPGQPLALSQQFAVNEIMNQLGGKDESGLYAVNGPPGTGKTTMLRDLVAAIVVRRAERLAELKSPQDAFRKKPLTWETDPVSGARSRRTLRPLADELTGFEMVIASSNNGAVQNVTLEIPAEKSVGPSWREQAAYLKEPAGLLLDSAPAWGAVAACLGKRQLRSDFVEAFWWGQPKEQRPRNSEDGSPPRGLRQLLTEHIKSRRDGSAEPDDPPLTTLSWTDATARFRAARAEVDSLVRERTGLADLAERLAVPDPFLDSLRSGVVDLHHSLVSLQERYARQYSGFESASRQVDEQHGRVARAVEVCTAAQRVVADAAGRVGAAEARLHDQDARHPRPGLIRRVLGREAVARWEAERAPFVARIGGADEELKQAEHVQRQRDHELLAARYRLQRLTATAETSHRECRLTLRQLERAEADMAAGELQVRARLATLEAEQRELDEARERWGEAFPGPEWSAAPEDRAAMEARELSAPWMDPEFAAARTRLFLAALDLHQALLAGAARTVRENLFAAMEVIKGSAPPGLPASTVLAAWQMLFLVVPAVSTTFASLSRMFEGIGRESIGWLLIDEAGQAAPQQAVGALWRSRRAVVVGDPLQLEPVVTLPLTAQKRLCRHFGVDGQWVPGASSVQSLADRQTRYGTWLGGAEQGPVWVGSPLRVHRRCDRLMFDVSNEIAYDGMMVYGVGERDDSAVPLHRSVWLHVPSAAAGGKWNAAEGRCLEKTLRLVEDRIAAEPEALPAQVRERLGESVFVVSPFREISTALRDSAASQLPDTRVGTVHTTQGKEADIVVIVLGTAANASGSRQWATKSPNLLNVAVTRARHRLIVIGDRRTWSRHRHFSALAAHPLLHHANAADWQR